VQQLQAQGHIHRRQPQRPRSTTPRPRRSREQLACTLPQRLPAAAAARQRRVRLRS